jgi:hypothetical protein
MERFPLEMLHTVGKEEDEGPGTSRPSCNLSVLTVHWMACGTGRRPQSGWYSWMPGVLVRFV